MNGCQLMVLPTDGYYPPVGRPAGLYPVNLYMSK